MRKNFSSAERWLPTSVKELEQRGWTSPDVILFTGDAYIDHPSCGIAIIGRVLESMGLKVAVVPQPNWRDDLRDFRKMGRPRLFFGVTSGNMDSMVNHYTANRRLRSDDAYTPGGKAGFRPDYATYVYASILKKLYPDVPVIAGGIEASLRRLVHYDYWSNRLKPSILAETEADLLVYGMGEKTIQKIAAALQQGVSTSHLRDIPQTAYLASAETFTAGPSDLVLPSFEECLKSKEAFAEAFRLSEEESNRWSPRRIIQRHGNHYVVVNPPETPSTEEEMDAIYSLPYTRLPHPRYKDKPIPAYEMIKHSITIHRGCFGGCSFCTISAHQGKFIQSRSPASIMVEVDAIAQLPGFKGHITDLGGPSANMYRMKGKNLSLCRSCSRYSCLHPHRCSNLNTSHEDLLLLYENIRRHPAVKKVTIGSGIRYDLFMDTLLQNHTHPHRYLEELMKYHVSGRLKVAPEHFSEKVLELMRKPSFVLFETFKKQFDFINKKYNLNLQLIPYLISSHPGCTTDDMALLVLKCKELHIKPEQVQGFTPTPMTLSSVMYYTGLHPYTLKPVYVASGEEQVLQHRFFFWYKKENRPQLLSWLKKHGRHDLVRRLFGK